MGETTPALAYMRFAKAIADGDDMGTIAKTYEMLVAMFDDPDELARWERYMESERVGFDELLDAVRSVTSEEVAPRPTEALSRSQDGPPGTVPSSRVVSFSQGTVRETAEEASSTDGALTG